MQRTQWMGTSSHPDTRRSQRRPPSGQRRGVARRGPCRTWALVTTVALAVALAVLPPAAMAVSPGDQLQITEVHVDAPNTITIMGEHFNLGSGLLAVTLGPTRDITAPCLTTPPTADLIICTFTDEFPPDGDYRLTVATGSTLKQTDHYDLTIGAVGLQGPPGRTSTHIPAATVALLPRASVNQGRHSSVGEHHAPFLPP